MTATACLPSLADVSTLPHECLLEVLSAVDASRALTSPINNESSSSRRLLRLQLTDGNAQCGAFEYKPLGAVGKAYLRRGAKIKIKLGTRVAGGMLLLVPELTEWFSAAPLDAAAGAATVDVSDAAPRFTPLPDNPTPPPQKPAAPPPPAAAPAPPPPPQQQPSQQQPSQPKPPPPKPPPPKPPPPKPPPPQAPTAPTAPALDPELIEQLLATGLSLADVHASLGLPPPQASAPSVKTDGAPQKGGGGRGKGGRKGR